MFFLSVIKMFFEEITNQPIILIDDWSYRPNLQTKSCRSFNTIHKYKIYPITTGFPAKEQLLEKSMCAKFQIDLKTWGTSSHIYRQTDGRTHMAKSTQLVILIIYIHISFYRVYDVLLCITNFMVNLIYPV